MLALVVRVLVEHDPAARTVGGPQAARATEQIVDGLDGSRLGGGGGHTVIIILTGKMNIKFASNWIS